VSTRFGTLMMAHFGKGGFNLVVQSEGCVIHQTPFYCLCSPNTLTISIGTGVALLEKLIVSQRSRCLSYFMASDLVSGTAALYTCFSHIIGFLYPF
jgi:hypothetical protein